MSVASGDVGMASRLYAVHSLLRVRLLTYEGRQSGATFLGVKLV